MLDLIDRLRTDFRSLIVDSPVVDSLRRINSRRRELRVSDGRPSEAGTKESISEEYMAMALPSGSFSA